MVKSIRYFGNLKTGFPIHCISEFPSTLLIPSRAWPIFASYRNSSSGRTGILLRKLVYRYRAAFFAGDFLQTASLRRVYQAPGQYLVKVSFRVENIVWLELGQMAAYLGISRCLMFVLLLEAAARDGFLEPVGTPTGEIACFDLERPSRITFEQVIMPELDRGERMATLVPQEYEELPFYIRYRLQYPLRL